jgi:hypothetical protein
MQDTDLAFSKKPLYIFAEIPYLGQHELKTNISCAFGLSLIVQGAAGGKAKGESEWAAELCFSFAYFVTDY